MAEVTRVGDITVHRIIEQEYAFMPALEMLPGLTPELLGENRAWMEPAALDKDGWLILCFQSYVLRTPHHVILVDSCVGNDKRRPTRPKWNMKTDDVYMTRLAAAGFSGRRHRLRAVHPSPPRPCRLEHAARERPLGADVSERALRVQARGVRLLDRR